MKLKTTKNGSSIRQNFLKKLKASLVRIFSQLALLEWSAINSISYRIMRRAQSVGMTYKFLQGIVRPVGQN